VQQGLVSLRPNFRGIGASEGHFDHGKGELLDMAALVEQFRVRYPEIAAKPWVLGGFSFGTSIGVQLYAQWDKLGKNLPNIVILTGSAALRFRHSEAKAPEDALVIHGELDEVVPLSEVMEWARPLGMPVVVIPEAGHFFHGKLLVLRQLVQTRLKALV
jgi:alpha/beta superfamily hydrolase